LHLAARHREKRQRCHQAVVTDLFGGVFVVMRGMVVLDRAREFADLLPADLEMVRIPVVGSDDVFSNGHGGRELISVLRWLTCRDGGMRWRPVHRPQRRGPAPTAPRYVRPCVRCESRGSPSRAPWPGHAGPRRG